MTTLARHKILGWLAVLVLFAVLGAATASEATREIGDPGDSDSIAFAAAARLVIDDPNHLYDPQAQSAVETSLLNIPRSSGFIAPFYNIAAAAVVLSPLARLSLSQGSVAFALASLVLFAASLLLVLRMLRSVPTSTALLIATASVLSVPAIDAIIQFDSLLCVALLASALLAERRMYLLAGVALATLVLKPQVAWLVLPALAAAGLWRYLIGFVLGAAAWLGASIAIAGPGGLVALLQLIARARIAENGVNADLPAVVSAMSGGTAGFIAAGAFAVVAVALLWWKRELLRGRPMAALAIGIPLSLLCAPHVSPQDLMLLTVTFAFLARRWALVALLEALALSAAAMVQLAMPMNARHLFPLVLLLVTATTARAVRARDTSRTPRERRLPRPLLSGSKSLDSKPT